MKDRFTEAKGFVTNDAGALAVFDVYSNSLVSEQYDTIEFGYTGNNVTAVTYKLGGSTVATLTLAYSGDNLTSVTRL